MHYLLSAIFVGIFFLDGLASQGIVRAEEIQLEFQMSSPELAEDTEVYITGSVPGLGNWNPGSKKMKYVGEHVWQFRLELSKSQELEYKYTLGDWSREGADEKGNPLPNFTYSADCSGSADRSATIKDRVDNWTSKPKREVSGQVTGTVKYHRQLSGEDIRPRDVVVWLPPEYDTAKDRYPVLYMHDGQNLFDPKTSAFGFDWQVDETCTRLIEKKIIGPIIVVGIYNTPERSREYLPGEKGNAYTRFVTSEVKTLVDKEYRTKPGREFTWVGGSSAGGICAFRMVWDRPEVFSKAICMSPAFKFEKSPGEVVVDYVATVLNTEQPPEGVAFYIDNGGIGLETRLQPGVDAMIKALEKKGFQREKSLRYLLSKEAPHSESAWAKRFPKAIEYIYYAPVMK